MRGRNSNAYFPNIIEAIGLLDAQLDSVTLIPEELASDMNVYLCIDNINKAYRVLSRIKAKPIVTAIKSINPKSAHLLKIKTILPKKNQVLKAAHFSHMTAAQLAIFSDAVVTLGQYVKNKNTSQQYDALLKFDELTNAVVESMRLRMSQTSQERLVLSNMESSFIEITPQKNPLTPEIVDETFSLPLPTLPFSHNDKYHSVPDYFDYYIKAYENNTLVAPTYANNATNITKHPLF